ncbi:MAG: hypothetical protein JO001_00720 [Alphaproteobacteria bacterium]|nr:hypothetical protein [Alphaproteobacteria bacterium]
MLSKFDDFPFHQTGNHFDTTETGDHRFFDRYWWVAYDRENRAQVNSGLGVYKNMNVLDGFGTVLLGSRQHNVRTSRVWRPEVERIGAGPLDYEIKEGLKSFRLTLAQNEYGVAFDLFWEATLPAFDEPLHHRRINGVIHEEYLRFYQFGLVNGWAEADGQRIEIRDWFGFRDRSFGVRPGVGGAPPSTPKPPASGGRDTAVISGMGFACEDGTHGSVQIQEDDTGRVVYSGGKLVRREGDRFAEYTLSDVTVDIPLATGTLRPTALNFDFSAGGQFYELRGIPVSDGFVYQGYGYYDGYWDSKGLGAWRGDNIVEGEIYDVSDQAKITDLSGRRQFPAVLPHEYPLSITLNGAPGMADSMVGFVGPHPRYRPHG